MTKRTGLRLPTSCRRLLVEELISPRRGPGPFRKRCPGWFETGTAFDSSLALLANEQGIDAAYDALVQPSEPQEPGETSDLKRALDRLRKARLQNRGEDTRRE
jgi:hypothetical protein